MEQKTLSLSALRDRTQALKQKWMFDGLIFSVLPMWKRLLTMGLDFDTDIIHEDFEVAECLQEGLSSEV